MPRIGRSDLERLIFGGERPYRPPHDERGRGRACGYLAGSASVAVPLEIEGSELLRLDVPLVHAAGGACY